jgi:thiamine pyrophosphate-dependent acetolactate synthase large subunit-like protein
VLRISSRPGSVVEPTEVVAVDDLRETVSAATGAARAGMAAADLRLEVDLDAPAPAGAVPLEPATPTAERGPLPAVDGLVAALAGPGVVRAGAIDGLREFAGAAGVGVANTWGAKGVFPWDSPHHMGTVGLQARDFELLGFADAALIVTTGIDHDESPPERYALAPVVDVRPGQLSAGLARNLRSPEPAGSSNGLYERLSAVAQPGYVADKIPLHPARAIGDIRAALPSGGVVAAQPGSAGLWVARTFPTTEPRSVVVPATDAPGVAAGVALVAALRDQTAIAVIDGPVDDATRAIVRLGERLERSFVLEIWEGDAPLDRVEEHAASLAAAFATPGVTQLSVPVDASDLRLLIEAAGRVVAWNGLL